MEITVSLTFLFYLYLCNIYIQLADDINARRVELIKLVTHRKNK